MTKMISDKSTRQQAIPFIATDFTGLSESGGLFFNIDAARIISDDLLVIIRCCTPRHANLIEAHLNLQITAVSALNVKVAIGTWNGVQAVSSYSQADIDRMHAAITGASAALASSGGTLLIDGLNLYPYIPKRGETNFNEDGFIVLLQFSRARVTDTLKKFEVACSALMGLI